MALWFTVYISPEVINGLKTRLPKPHVSEQIVWLLVPSKSVRGKKEKIKQKNKNKNKKSSALLH